MKKLVLVIALFTVLTVKAQQKNPVKDNKLSGEYASLQGKDITTVMKVLHVKDTVGKTYLATFPEYMPNEKLLVLRRTNGDDLAFYKNGLQFIVSKAASK